MRIIVSKYIHRREGHLLGVQRAAQFLTAGNPMKIEKIQGSYIRCCAPAQTRDMLANQFQIFLIKVFLFTSSWPFLFRPALGALLDLFIFVDNETFANL